MSAASEDAVRQRAGDRRCSRRTLPSSPSPLAAQGKDGEGLDRPRGADTGAGMPVPHAVRLRPAPESRRRHSRRWSHGRGGGPARTVTWAAFGLLSSLPCCGLERGTPDTRPEPQGGVVQATPGVRSGVT